MSRTNELSNRLVRLPLWLGLEPSQDDVIRVVSAQFAVIARTPVLFRGEKPVEKMQQHKNATHARGRRFPLLEKIGDVPDGNQCYPRMT
jgi:hypothetical protein